MSLFRKGYEKRLDQCKQTYSIASISAFYGNTEDFEEIEIDPSDQSSAYNSSHKRSGKICY